MISSGKTTPTFHRLSVLLLLAGVMLTAALPYLATRQELANTELTQAQGILIGNCLRSVNIPLNTAVTVRPTPGKSPVAVQVVSLAPIPLQPASSDKVANDKKSAVLSARTITLQKNDGNFEIVVPESHVFSTEKSSSLMPERSISLSPTTGSLYKIAIPDGLKARAIGSDDAKQFEIPANTLIGTLGEVAVSGITNYEYNARLWLNAPDFVTSDDPASGTAPADEKQNGQPAVFTPRTEATPIFTKIGVKEGVLQVATNAMLIPQLQNAPASVLSACVATSKDGPWILSPVSTGGSPAILTVSLPHEVARYRSSFFYPVFIALSNQDGKLLGFTHFPLITKWAALLISIVLVLLGGITITRLLGMHRRSRNKTSYTYSQLFLGVEDSPSLSLLQILFWSVIAIWGMIYAYVVTGTLITLSDAMVGLLGIAGIGSVTARWIAASGRTEASSTSSNGSTIANRADSRTSTTMFLSMLSTNGRFDLLKFQLFCFTVVIGLYVVGQIFHNAAIPDLDTNTLLLLGVSQGIYVTSKLSTNTQLSKAQVLLADRDILLAYVRQATDEIEGLKRNLPSLPVATQANAQQGLTTKQAKLAEIQQQLSSKEAAIKQAFAELGLKIS